MHEQDVLKRHRPVNVIGRRSHMNDPIMRFELLWHERGGSSVSALAPSAVVALYDLRILYAVESDERYTSRVLQCFHLLIFHFPGQFLFFVGVELDRINLHQTLNCNKN